jgi:hypothetical protein
MPLDVAIARVSEIRTLLGAAAAAPVPVSMRPPANPPAAAVQTSAYLPSSPSGFAASLAAQMQAQPSAAPALNAPAGAGDSTGQRILAFAQQEVAKGVIETSVNDSPDIARYRTATEGAMAGAPWCAYFVSYLAKQAGAPIGDHGQGMGQVDAITAWAQRNGRFVPTSGQPQPGDLALFDEHIGVVESVGANGKINLIEGNSSNRVQRVERSLSELVGFARLG